MRQFAGRPRLRVTKDGCGELIAPGKHGHLFDYEDGERFGIVLEDNRPHQPSKAKALLSRRRQARAAGFAAHQLGECESILLFNPQDLEQARSAIRLIGARPRRTLSPERLQKFLAAGQRSRYSRKPTVQDARTAV